MSLAINIIFSVPASTVFCLADQHAHNCLSAIMTGVERLMLAIELTSYSWKTFDVVPHDKLIALRPKVLAFAVKL